MSRGQKARNEASQLVRETREGDVYDESLARNEWKQKKKRCEKKNNKTVSCKKGLMLECARESLKLTYLHIITITLINF